MKRVDRYSPREARRRELVSSIKKLVELDLQRSLDAHHYPEPLQQLETNTKLLPVISIETLELLHAEYCSAPGIADLLRDRDIRDTRLIRETIAYGNVGWRLPSPDELNTVSTCLDDADLSAVAAEHLPGVRAVLAITMHSIYIHDNLMVRAFAAFIMRNPDRVDGIIDYIDKQVRPHHIDIKHITAYLATTPALAEGVL